MASVNHIEIDSTRAGQRIDNYLIGTLKGVPRSRVYRLIRRGEVRVNGARVKPEYKLKAGDSVRVPPVRTAAPRVTPARGDERNLLDGAILHEDERLLVLNKPAGLAVHGGSGISLGVIELLRATRPELPYLELVHRLDRETSGCLLIAKRRSELRVLHELIRANRLDKRYVALVEGRWPDDAVEVSAPLARTAERSGGPIARVAPGGKQAITRFVVLERFADFTLVEANPATGRTHQIRVHARYAGHPILGDSRYGTKRLISRRFGRGLGRMYLHASRLTIPAAGGPAAGGPAAGGPAAGSERVRRFSAPLDDRFERILRQMKDNNYK